MRIQRRRDVAEAMAEGFQETDRAIRYLQGRYLLYQLLQSHLRERRP
jgi:hypothetical protein